MTRITRGYRNPHKPTDISRAEVRSLISFGITQDQICKYLNVSDKTLNKYYKKEIETSVTIANAAVASVLYDKAVNQKDLSAVIFWLKTRARWRTTDHDDDNKDELLPEAKKLKIELDEKNKKEF